MDGAAAAAPLHDLRLHAAADPGRLAVACGDERLGYGELEALANRFAGVFRHLGLARGDHISALLGNRPAGLAVGWAAWRSGLYLTPLPSTLAPAELRYLVDDCEARVVLANMSLADLAAGLPGETPRGPLHRLSLGGAIEGFAPVEPLLAVASPLPHDDEPLGTLMMYTSGTTGAPKGVIRPLLPPGWRGTPPFAADLIDPLCIGGEGVRYLSTAPLYHAAPLRTALAVTAGGGSVHVMDRFDAAATLRLVEDERITHSQWVPAMLQRLLALPPARRAAFAAPSHRCAIHGAAPCPPAVKRAMIDWRGPILLEYYSGSEGIGLTLIDSDEWLRHPGSVGRARKGMLHIVDDAGGELPPGETGLVCFSGTAPFEYFKAPDKTARSTLPQGRRTFGDIGHADAEGRLTLTDRRDDLIISGGVNLYPQEIEAVLREASGVADCAVVGVPDERFGERPVAFLVALPGTVLSTQAVRDHCAGRLGRFKQPTAMRIVDSLPYSPTGKLRRRALRALEAPPAD